MMGTDSLSRDLHTILNSFVDLIECDGGSIYTVQKREDGAVVLNFRAMVTRSLGIHAVPEKFKDLIFELNETTSVGRAGVNRSYYRETFDEHHRPATTDEILNYTTQSILSGPILSQTGELVGVVQLINKKNQDGSEALGFTEKDQRLISSVSAQAALAIENSLLVQEQQNILDGFVQACVTAVEARDPVTAGHSSRVCELTLNLAEATNRVNEGALAKLILNPAQMRELRYAALLHDIGKISVKESVLNKEKKLYSHELEIIEMRFKMLRMAIRQEYQGNEIEIKRRLKELDHALASIQSANEPSVLPTEISEKIKELTRYQIQVPEETPVCALHDHEHDKLCVKRGSLTKDERDEIEKHVSFTYEILRMVPWSRGLENLPMIAYRHHEKLDGTGYPARVKAPEIPIQSRMITVCDIFDALTAKDRPYKAAVPLDRALFILEAEVKEGKLDADLLKVFIESRAYELPFTVVRKKAA